MINTNENITKHNPTAYQAKYAVTTEKYEHNGTTRISYGINAFLFEDGILNPVPCISIHDISSNESKIRKLVDTCNKLNVSIDHIYDVIDDFLM